MFRPRQLAAHGAHRVSKDKPKKRNAPATSRRVEGKNPTRGSGQGSPEEGASVTEIEAKDVARFFARVKIGRGPDACWIWKGERQSQKRRPYGLFAYQQDGKVKRVVAHKFAFHLAGGVLQDDEQAGHTCHHSLCVRFGHLEALDVNTNQQQSLWRL